MEKSLVTYGTQLAFTLEDSSSIAVVRRAGNALARELQFNETLAGQLALLITEAATNIIKHAGHGKMLLRALHQPNAERSVSGVEVISIDKGPGISNLHMQMEDGNSTTGTYGIGLGTLKRLSHEFDIYSQIDKGTVVWMVIWNNYSEVLLPDWEVGAICLPIQGEEVCGDNWAIAACETALSLIVADGLGHGPDAAVAANAAVSHAYQSLDQSPSVLMQKAHSALKGTRGAAVAISKIDLKNTRLGFTGIGNISVCLFYSDKCRHLVSHNGIVGSNMRKLQEFSEQWEHDALLIAHSDGISTRWDINDYPELRHCHSGLIAAVIYRDFSRGHDDATIVVVRETFKSTGVLMDSRSIA